jgi:hypothetical protein
MPVFALDEGIGIFIKTLTGKSITLRVSGKTPSTRSKAKFKIKKVYRQIDNGYCLPGGS